MAADRMDTGKVDPLAMMTRLSPLVSVYEPVQISSHVASDGNAPKLILLGNWMDARDAHIAKYITRYQALYPASAILLVKYLFKQIFLPAEVNQVADVAVSYVRSKIDSGVLSASPNVPEILIHLFSNGGMTTATAILEAFRQKTGAAFPLHATVYDSCPGRFSWKTSYNAFTLHAPKGWARWPIVPLIHLWIAYIWLTQVLWGRPYPLLMNGIKHNSHQLVRETNRTYIYSDTDEMIPWQHVELHASEALQHRFNVRKEKFIGSPHVAHMRFHEQRYWKIVTETWQTGTNASAS